MERVDVSQSFGGGPESFRFEEWNLNCNAGNHRIQRLHYLRDGTQQECASAGEAGKYKVKSTIDDLDESHEQKANTEQNEGTIVVYPLPQSVFSVVTSVEGQSLEWIDVREILRFPTPGFESEASNLSTLANYNNERDGLKSWFFGALKNYIHLHDSFPVDTVRSVFTPVDLRHIKRMQLQKQSCFFFMQSVTQHLAPQYGKYVLCEVDFQRQAIVFYHTNHDTINTLRFYAETMWNQFVLPSQERVWKVELLQAKILSLDLLLTIVHMRRMDHDILSDLFDLPNLEQRVRFFIQQNIA